MTCLESADEDVKTAAAFALGRCAVGSMSAVLPVVLEVVKSGSGSGGSDLPPPPDGNDGETGG